jgi:hypothetical protein
LKGLIGELISSPRDPVFGIVLRPPVRANFESMKISIGPWRSRDHGLMLLLGRLD